MTSSRNIYPYVKGGLRYQNLEDGRFKTPAINDRPGMKKINEMEVKCNTNKAVVFDESNGGDTDLNGAFKDSL